MKKGFTLAEVLITLVVIGVVAALTIPVVVHKYQQHQLYVQFMKEFNTLQRVVQTTVGENGGPAGWFGNEVTMDDIFDTYFLPYLQVASVESLPNYNIKGLDGSVIAPLSDVINLGSVHGSKYYILNDGSAMAIADLVGGENIIFAFDTNGKKAPNAFGRDIFIIELESGYSNNGKYLVKSQHPTGNNNDACSVTGSGIQGMKGLGCADRLLKEGKMDY